MLKLNLYNLEGKTKDSFDFDEKNFGKDAKDLLIAQAINKELSNTRQDNAHTKHRDEVRGGGRKPWKQKGTGRARAGSSRSPIWIGGGTTFGPRSERNHHQRLPKSMRNLVKKTLLKNLLTKNKFYIIDQDKDVSKISTKNAYLTLKDFKLDNKKVLFLIDNNFPNLAISFRNIPSVKLCSIGSLANLDLVETDAVIIPKILFDKLLEIIDLKNKINISKKEIVSKNRKK